MKNDAVEKTVKNTYDFVNKKATYYQVNKEKIPKKSREYRENLSEDENIEKRNYAYNRKHGG